MPRRFPKFLFQSVRGRLVLLVATITLTALFLGLLLVTQAYRNERKTVEKHLSATARALASSVDLQLGQYEAMLKGLATFPSLRRRDFEAFDTAARAVTENPDKWVILIDDTGQQLINTRAAKGAPLPKIEIEPGLKEAIAQNRSYVSDVSLGAVTKTPLLYVAIPIIQDNRRLILCLATVPSVFAEGIAVRSLAPNGTVAIIDRKGIVAARNRSPERFVGTPASADMVAAMNVSSEGVKESVTLDGIPVLSAFCHSQNGWTVVNAVPRDEIYGSAGRLITLALALSGALLVISVFLSGWIGRALVQGVGTLVKSTEIMGKGETPPQEESGLAEIDFVADTIRGTAQQLIARRLERERAEEALRDETRVLELLNHTGTLIASQLDLQSLVQVVTDSSTKLSGAKFGAFFYTKTDDKGGSFMLYTLSGAPREAFEKFGHPRATPLFGPTFAGAGVVRLDDVTKDARYGTMPPHHGMPKGHLPVCSYLAVPVVSRSGEVLGGLFFGHPEPGVFTERSERLVVGVAAQAAIAIDNARLYETSQREISERKRAEVELQKSKEELEQKVQERTASLQETTQQLETFCYSIAHDLRAPLRAQQSFAQALLFDYKDSLDDIGRDYVERIGRSAKRLDALVNDLLAYSRISRTELQFAAVDLQALVKEIQSSLAEQIETAKAHVTYGHFFPVLAHEATLQLVITNLFENALKFVKPDAAPMVHIWAEEKGSLVRLWVEDKGIGINRQGLTKIFGVFERLHPVTVYPGTGIGLAIVQKGVERMGGKVGVESEPDQGSRFWIELPKAIEQTL